MSRPEAAGPADWRILPAAEALDLVRHQAVWWKNVRTEIELPGGRMARLMRAEFEGKTWVLDFAGGWQVRHEFTEDGGWLRVTTVIRNGTTGPLPLRRVRVLAGSLGKAVPRERVFAQSNTMTGRTGIFPWEGPLDSDSCAGLTDAAGTAAMVAGFEQLGEAFYQFRLESSRGEDCIVPVCLREDVSVDAGAELEISPLLIGAGESLAALLEDYARRTAAAMDARPAGETMTGWCSWYHYYGNDTAADILANARSLASSPLGRQIKVIQIDDGWNRPSDDAPRVWGDWFAGAKFPQGMRAVADQLHAMGFQAGLWLAPFSVDKASRLAAEHPDWLLRVRNPETGLLDPAGPGNVYGLDLTHPGVLAWLETTFARVFGEWNFDYVKIDFLMHGVLPGDRHDPRQTSAQAFRKAMQVIRRCARPDKFILNCGSPLGPAIGLCDGMRIGPDVGGRWDTPINLRQWPQGNCSIRAAAYPALFRQWMHGKWWQNDPDCLVVREHAVPFEVEALTGVIKRLSAGTPGVAESDFGLSDEEAGFWVRAVWFTGGMAIVSEVWDELSPARQRLLAHAFPPHGREVRWLDYYRHPDVCLMQTVGGQPMIGMFNLADEPRAISPDRSPLAGCREWTEWLDGTKLLLDESTPPIMLPARSARVWLAEAGQNVPDTPQHRDGTSERLRRVKPVGEAESFSGR